MNARRLVSASFAGAALVAAPLLTGGVASASDSHDHGHTPPAPTAPDCNSNATGSATNSPGVGSGNVVQVPVSACQLTGDLDLGLNGTVPNTP